MGLLTFDDITLVPKMSTLTTRSDADTSVKIWKYDRHNPIMSANMETVTGPKMATAMWDAGGIGVLHRFQSIEKNMIEYLEVTGDNISHILKDPPARKDCFVSVGVKVEGKLRARGLYEAGARMFCIDIAHGHSVLMHDMISWMREKWGDQVFIMAGNVATSDGARDLAHWGANIIKCGVSPGSVCTTRLVTGHGVPQVSAIQDCFEGLADYPNVKLIADGGIRSSGDIVKSFVFGADYVMLGGLLAGTDETPGEVIDTPHGNVKVYMGSASYDRKGITKEGIRTTVPCKGPLKDVVDSLVGGIRSGMSYSNAKKLEDLASADWQKQSTASYAEGLPHMRK